MPEGQTYSETRGKTPTSDSAPVTSDTDPSLRPDAYERFLAAAAVVLFILVSIALLRGHHAIVTILTVPMLVFAARHHRIARHRSAVRGLVTGALLTAGYFTLIPNRMLGGWLWN
jgi:hypothetical protein